MTGHLVWFIATEGEEAQWKRSDKWEENHSRWYESGGWHTRIVIWFYEDAYPYDCVLGRTVVIPEQEPALWSASMSFTGAVPASDIVGIHQAEGFDQFLFVKIP